MTAELNNIPGSDAEESSVSQEPLDLTNKSVVKATVLLSELGRHRNGITVTELAQAVKMTRPTAFRLLLTLEQTGFVDRTDNNYRLGWQMARLGRLADPYTGAVARIQPVLDEYAAKLNETLGFAMLRNETEFDLIAEASGTHMLNVSHDYVGGSWPIHASATGKLVLAELNDDEKAAAILPDKLASYTPRTITQRKNLFKELEVVRQQGYAVLDDELEEGLFVLGVPVRDSAGALIGVLSVNGPTQRMKSAHFDRTIETAKQAADELAKALI